MKDIHLQTSPDCLPDLIGLTYSSYDCWELVKLFYLKMFAISLFDYEYKNPDARKEISYLIDIKKQDFKEVSNPKFGDILVIRVHGLPCHLGVYINKNKFLHTTEGTGSVLDDLHKWRHKIVGKYRYDQNKNKCA